MQDFTIEGFRLSPQQKNLWSLQQQYNYSYCTQGAILITGNLSVEVLQASLQNIVDRHEILRTTFHHLPGIKTPIQVIDDTNTPLWCSLNLSDFDQQTQVSRIENFWQEQRQFIFDLQKGPLLRLSLLRLSGDQHILLIALPSLCADSRTLKNIISEISQTYALYLQGEELLEEPIQYIQFSEWQNELIESEDAESGKNYWLQSLPRMQEKTILPFEGEADNNQLILGTHTINITLDLVERISKIASYYNTNTANFLLACWQILIWRLTKQSSFIIKTLLTGRKYEELCGTLGLLAKWLPINSSIDQGFKFFEVLLQTSDHLRQADKYQEYFPEEYHPDSIQEPGNLPISFEFEELPEEYNAGNVSFSLYKRYVCFDCSKLKLACLQGKESLIIDFHYHTKLFSTETIQRLSEQFLVLLESATTHPQASISQLEILPSQERHQLLVEFNKSQIDYPQDQCIHQLFEQQVEQTPNNIAVLYENQRLTYRELNTKANQLAHYLIKLGIGPEVKVGLCMQRSLNMIVGLLGILKTGAAYLPLDPAQPTEGLTFRLQDTQASILLTQESLVKNLPSSTDQVICLDTGWEDIAQEPETNPQTLVKPENLVYVIFTSGSTGKPKGVNVEHRQLVNYLYAISDRLNLPKGASFANVSTIAADLGNTVIFPALCTGGCLHIISQERVTDAQALADYFQRYSIDCLKIVPSHLAALLASSPSESILPQCYLILGGEAASWDLIETIHQQKPNCQIFNHYGPTETTVGVLTYAVEFCKDAKFPASASHRQCKTVPLGRPLANTQVYILDEQLQPVAIGVMGELYIGGAGVARGYDNRPELTAEKFIEHPDLSLHRLYKTGDLARYLSDGNIEFLGRVDQQVKIRGFRIELGEIEVTLRQHQGVQEVVVLVKEEGLNNKRLIAYIVPSPKFRSQAHYPALTNELRSFAVQKLPEYMIPSAFVLLKKLPLTSNGKVDNQALLALESTYPTSEAPYIAPRTSVEKQLAEIWTELLGLEQVSIHDNFFELGGHSLLVTQLTAQIRKIFQVDLSLNSLFEVPTIAGLAAKIGRSHPDSPSNSGVWATLLADAVLDPVIGQNGLAYKPSVSEKAIFLTGATGFLGAFLLYELLQQTSADIYCLVRAVDAVSAKKKLQSSLESYLLWDEATQHRIIPVVGDLSQPLLDLSLEQFRLLATQIDTIYHNGAIVNFTYPYSALKAANVLGTQEVLRLACEIKIKPVHFISSIGVVSSSQSHAGFIGEQDSLSSGEPPSDGYTQSKFVAEKLMTLARERGLPVCIFRPGRISGSSQTGACNPDDHTYRMIRGCIQLGSVPERDTTVNISPVDYVSRAIIHLSRQQESLGKIFHLINPFPASWNEVVDYIRSFGYQLMSFPQEQWQAKLLKENDQENALYPLISIFSPELSDGVSVTTQAKIDCQNTFDGLAKTSINCPPVNRQLFEVYFSYLVRQGLLQLPQIQEISL